MKTSWFFRNACAANVALWLSMAAVWAQAPRAAEADSSLAARVRRLEDIEEIRTLLLDYGRYLDSRNLVAYSRLFARDGEWVGGFGTAKSPAGIQAFMEKNLGTGPNRGNTYHILSNFIINVNGDTATAWPRNFDLLPRVCSQFWDLVFGTFYVRSHQPGRFGLGDSHPPNSVWSQIVSPFSAASRREAA